MVILFRAKGAEQRLVYYEIPHGSAFDNMHDHSVNHLKIN